MDKNCRVAVFTSRKLPFVDIYNNLAKNELYWWIHFGTTVYIYIYISKSRNPKISRKFLAVSTSSFDGVKFFVLHLIHSVMVNLRCYRATYRHGVIPPPRQDSVQSRHLFQGQTGRGPASAVGMRLAKRDSWWRKKNSWHVGWSFGWRWVVYSCKYRNRIYISNYIYIDIHINHPIRILTWSQHGKHMIHKLLDAWILKTWPYLWVSQARNIDAEPH